MSFWQQRALPFIDNARAALLRTPVEAALGFMLAATLTWAITDGGRDAGRATFEAALTGYLALVATFGVSALHAFRAFTSRTRWLLTATYLVACGLYGGLVLDSQIETELWRYGALALAATMGFGVLPAALSWRTRHERDAFWHFNARALAQIANVAAYLISLYIGLALGLAAVNNLFELSLEGDLWGYMFAWVVVALGPWLIASGLPALVSDGATLTSQARRALTLLATYLILPLVSLYMLILYAYQLKVVASGFELPKNVMSFLTLGAAILLLIGMFIGDQLRRTEEGQGVFSRVVEFLPAAFIPLLPMGLWAVLVRVQQHGWTEFRYARVLSLICLFIIFSYSAYRLVRRQQQPLAATFATFGVAGVIAAVGPLSMTEVGRTSQLARFNEQIARYGLLGPDGKLRPLTEPIAIKDGDNPQETLDYLVSAHGHSSVAHLYPADVLAQSHDNRNSYLASNRLNWSNNLQLVQVIRSATFNGQQEGLVTIPAGARTLINSHIYTHEGATRQHTHLTLKDNILELRDAAGVAQARRDLKPLIERSWQAAVHQPAQGSSYVSYQLPAEDQIVEIRGEDGAVACWVVLKTVQVSLDPTPGSGVAVTWIDATLFLP